MEHIYRKTQRERNRIDPEQILSMLLASNKICIFQQVGTIYYNNVSVLIQKIHIAHKLLPPPQPQPLSSFFTIPISFDKLHSLFLTIKRITCIKVASSSNSTGNKAKKKSFKLRFLEGSLHLQLLFCVTRYNRYGYERIFIYFYALLRSRYQH